MTNINLQGKNFDLTDAIKEHVLKRVTDLEKLLSTIEDEGGQVMVDFEVGKSTEHHKSGEVFHSSCLINIDGKKFYASSDKEDLYQAVDEIKENLFRDIKKNKERERTLFRRGAKSIKKMMKGLSKRNPWTSRYGK